ncbi:MAG: xylulokinase [Thermoflexales bacterium]|nr:xylulokinase [Thermoflexales bacterium]
MAFFMGIDVSTTATKALLIDPDGRVVGVASSEYSYETPRPMWTEQHPHLWWQATVASIRQVLAESGVNPADVQGVGLTGQMHGLVLLDEKGQVLRPAILWNDQRTAAECDEIRARLGKERLIRITGNDALTGFTAPKILWVRNNEPEIYARARHILLPKDYIRYRLTGEYAIDKADGAGTILFDLKTRDWSREVLEALAIDPFWLPPTFEGPEITGRITAEAAAETGLKAGTPVMAGGGDQSAQAVGVGAVEPGVVALTLGTSGVVFASTQEPFIEPEGRLHAFCHAVPGRWHLMGVMLSAGGSLRWYRDTVAPGTDFDTLLAPAATVPPGSEGLLYLPYLTGERTPYPDPLARGAFVGLTVRHSLAHMTRAVLEGVAFGLRDSFELMKAVGLAEITQVRASGGGARSPLWRQILADVLGVELVTVNTTEGAAYGAALLAATGAGAFGSVVEACSAVIRITGSTVPGPATEVYQRAYPTYRSLYPALRPVFYTIAQFVV